VVEEYHRERSEIVATLPQRTGSNREKTAYYLATSAHGLNPVDSSSLRAEIAEEFAGLSPGTQSMLLGIGWKELCDPTLPIPPEPLDRYWPIPADVIVIDSANKPSPN
jgi:hypothetical protein